MSSLPKPFAVFQDRFDSLEEVVQTVYVDAGENQFRVEVRAARHPSDPRSDHFVIHYFVKRGNQYVDDDTSLPWAERNPRKAKKRA
jgi:hypothetical protein